MKIVGEYPPLSIILSYNACENVAVDLTIKHSVDHKPFHRTRTSDTHTYVVVKVSTFQPPLQKCGVVFPFP